MSSLAFLGGSPGAGEMVVILLAILLLFGARRVPEIARNIGRALSEFRRAARDMQDELMRADLELPPDPPPPGPARPRDDLPAASGPVPADSEKAGPHETG